MRVEIDERMFAINYELSYIYDAANREQACAQLFESSPSTRWPRGALLGARGR
jgi:hypothetical protein